MAESSKQSQLGSVLATVFRLFILIILLVIKMSSISSKCYFQTFTLALMVTVSLTSSSTIMSKANKVDIPKVSQNIYVKEVKSIQVKISYKLKCYVNSTFSKLYFHTTHISENSHI